MNSEVYSIALRNTLLEIRNICPDIKNSFMFKRSGEIIVADENTPEEITDRVVIAFNDLLEKADAIGGVERIKLEGSEGVVDVTRFDDLYLATITSRKADLKYLSTIIRVLIPTVLKLLKDIHPSSLKSVVPPMTKEPEISIDKETEETHESPEDKMRETPEKAKPETKAEPASIESSTNQLIVEDLRGFLAPSDTVRIDNSTLSEWQESHGIRSIVEVEIETFNGMSTQCKVKPIKDWKYEGKGVIRMPEKIQLTLEIEKGELVRVKPVSD